MFYIFQGVTAAQLGLGAKDNYVWPNLEQWRSYMANLGQWCIDGVTGLLRDNDVVTWLIKDNDAVTWLIWNNDRAKGLI